MKFVQGNIWLAPLPVIIVVTTNSQLDKNGYLVMGAGIALEAKQKIPNIAADAGKIVEKFGRKYGFQSLRHGRVPGKPGYGIFQTKMSWAGDASLDLVEYSASMLAPYAQYNADIPIRLNYPGIGLGRLAKEQVRPVLEKYLGNSENVSVYYV